MNFIITASTDKGNFKEINQDGFFARTLLTPFGEIAFAVLCDGMGGLASGEIASATMVDGFKRWFDEKILMSQNTELSDLRIRREWTELICEYNEKIRNYGNQNGIKLGTTLTAVLLTERRYYIANVGDTRAYVIADNVNLLTKDQTLVAREVELGHISLDEAQKDKRRNILLQCIGVTEAVFPEFYFGETLSDRIYMLCSDGFRHEITEEEILQYLNPDDLFTADNIKSRLDDLITLNQQRDERDNITVIAIRSIM